MLLIGCSGILYALAFPPWSLWPLAWIALAPLFLAVRDAGPWRAAGLTWLWTMVACALLIPWFGSGIASYFAQPTIVGIITFVGAPTVGAALEYTAIMACYARLARTHGVGRPFVIAAAWVTADLARVRFVSGNPWGVLAPTQVDAGPFAQIADVTGMYGVTFVVVAANAALAEAGALRRAPADAPRHARTGLVLVAVVAAIAFAAGARRRDVAHADVAGAPTKRIAVVQGNVDVGTQWRPEFYGANLDVYLRLTGDAQRAASPAVVVWPENAMTFFIETEPRYRHAIGSVLQAAGTELLAGGPRSERGTDGPYHTSAFVVGSDGNVVALYDKRLLIPFAERLPFARAEFFLRRFARVRELAPGAAWTVLPTAAGPAGVLICNEALFPAAAAAEVRAGAGYLVVLANDNWTTSVQYGLTALQTARLRAIETRRFVVRASTSGPSAIIDPVGRIVDRTAPGISATLAGDVAVRPGLTPYTRFGDWLSLLCAVAVGCRLAMSWPGDRIDAGSLS